MWDFISIGFSSISFDMNRYIFEEICQNVWSIWSFIAAHTSNVSQFQCQTHITVGRWFALFFRQIKIWETGYQNSVDSCFCFLLFFVDQTFWKFDLHMITLCDVNRKGIHVTFDVSIFALVFSGIFRCLFLVQREPENLLNCSNSWLLNVNDENKPGQTEKIYKGMKNIWTYVSRRHRTTRNGTTIKSQQ